MPNGFKPTKTAFFTVACARPQKITQAKRNLRSLSLASNAFSHKVDDYFPPVVYRVEKRHNQPWGLKHKVGEPASQNQEYAQFNCRNRVCVCVCGQC